MTKEQLSHLDRLSLVDGSVDQFQVHKAIQSYESLEPIYEEYIVQVLTLEGLEDQIKKRIVGFKNPNKKRSENA